ncbi:serine hydrolase domain-containing protein [Delftia lacustris]|uniref:serine hydrolase domain-containing protein n=1 Tax=Delftia lacustris TaxID=558537 RepID=UPI0028638568|nr:serine hydrolase [Delftia lacustris]MDR6732333.1 CubicO group peptidase (beta-lactamase class C family) [Delftia lacustris]
MTNNGFRTDRRRWLQTGAALATLGCTACASVGQGGAFSTGTGTGTGLAEDLGERLDQGVQSGELANLHAVVVMRHGRLALERYFEGEDERWGEPLGKVAFNADSLHDVRSVSKSIVGLLYGMALAEGKVPALDTPLVQAFPAYGDLAADGRRRAILISHALGMTMGLQWDEDLPYSDPRNSEIAMERSSDRYRYVLEQPVVAPPGERWCYSGGATALLGHLIAQGSGMPLLDYARHKLFAPLSIDKAEWTPGTNGEAAAASGLRLRARDLARIGQLVLQQGEWQGRALVARHWIVQSMQPRVDAWPGLRYGHHWYVGQTRAGLAYYMAIGLGGQRLVVVPQHSLVYAVFMGNYDSPQQVQRVGAVQGLIAAALR